MLPVMIGALVAMLEGLPALNFLFVGSPAAISTAAAWTWIRIRDDIVEVCISLDLDGVAVLSRHDASEPRHPQTWKRLFDIEVDRENRVILTVGHEEFRIDADRFPDVDRLVEDCRRVVYSS
jgi:hypothetical protein